MGQLVEKNECILVGPVQLPPFCRYLRSGISSVL